MSALLRLGRREAARHKLRSSLVLALIGLPVAFGVVALILYPHTVSDSGDYVTASLGDADAFVSLTPGADGSADPAATPWRDPNLSDGVRVLPASELTGWVEVGEDGLVASVDLAQIDSSDPMVSTKFPLVAGVRPTALGEVTLSSAALDQFDVEVGDELDVALPDARLKVVGESRTAACGECVTGVLAPDSIERPTLPTEADPFPAVWTGAAWRDVEYISAPPGSPVLDVLTAMSMSASQPLAESSEVEPGQPLNVQTRANLGTSSIDEMTVRNWTVVAGAFVLLWTGLVAASGLAVGARRRKRELGLLAANGADPRALRFAVVSEGVVLGLLGSVGGAAIGLVVGVGASPAVKEATRSIATSEVPWLWVLALGAAGVVAATAAAWSAAAGLTRLSPAQLLAGQRPAPRPAPAWFVAGIVLMVAGGVGLRIGRSTRMNPSDSIGRPLLAGAVLVVTLGVIAVVVGLLRIAGRVTTSGPTSVRLAGRDLSRQGLRVAAASAAVSLTLTAAVAGAAVNESNEVLVNQRTSQVSATRQADLGEIGEATPRRSRLVDGRIEVLTAGPALVDEITRAGWQAGSVRGLPPVETLRVCEGFAGEGFATAEGSDPLPRCSAATIAVIDDGAIGTLPQALREPLRADRAMLTSSFYSLEDPSGEPADFVAADELLDPSGANGVSFGVSPFSSGPSAVYMSEAAAEARGFDLTQAAPPTVFIGLDGASDESLDALRGLLAAEGFGLNYYARTSEPPVGWIVAGVATAVAVVTLLIVMIALALVRVESRGEDQVLLIAGASPGLSRRVQGARAGLMVFAAAIPATVAGWYVAWSVLRRATPVPWWAVGLVVVCLPLVAAAAAALFTRPPRQISLQ